MSIKVQGQVVITDDKKGLFDRLTLASIQLQSEMLCHQQLVTSSLTHKMKNFKSGMVLNGVQRGGANGEIFPPVEVLTPVNGAGLNEGDSYTPLIFCICLY